MPRELCVFVCVCVCPPQLSGLVRVVSSVESERASVLQALTDLHSEGERVDEGTAAVEGDTARVRDALGTASPPKDTRTHLRVAVTQAQVCGHVRAWTNRVLL